MQKPLSTDAAADRAAWEAAYQQLQQRATAPDLSASEAQALLAEALTQQQALLRDNHQLRAAATRLQAAEAVVGSGSYELDLATNVLHFSDGMCRLFGEAPGAFKPSQAWIDARSDPADARAVQQVVALALRERRPYRYTRRIRHADGQWRTLESHGRVVTDATGQVLRLEGVVQDITAWQPAEQSQHATEEQFRLFAAASLNPVYKMSADWRHMNQLVGQQFLADTPATTESWLQAHIPTENWPTVSAAIAQAIQTKSTFELEHPIFQADGAVGWVHSRAVPVLDARGELVEWLGTASDITARKQAEQGLQVSRELLQATLDSSLDMVQVFEAVRDEQGAIVDFTWTLSNEAAEKITGHVIGQRLRTHNPGVVEAGVFDTYRRVVETGQPNQTELHYTGEQFAHWFLQSTVKLHDGVVATHADITASKQAEQEVLRLRDEVARYAEDKYHALFESIDEGYCLLEVLLDESGRCADVLHLEANQAYQNKTGLGDVVGRRALEVMPDVEPEWLAFYGNVALTGQPARIEYHVDAVGRWFTCHASRVGGEGSRLVAIIFDDVTSRKQHEQHQQFLLKLNDALRPLATPAEVQRAATRVIGEHLQVDRAMYAEITPDGETVVVVENYLSGRFPAFVGSFPLAAYGEMVIEPARRGQSLLIEDVAAVAALTEAEKAAYQQIGSTAFVTIPLLKGGRWVANFVVHQGAPRHWTTEEIALIQETAERTWAAVERAKAEEALGESEERFRNLVESYAQAVWETDPAGQVVHDSPSWRAQTGQTAAEWLGYGWVGAIHPDDQAYAGRQWQESVAAGRAVNTEFRLRHTLGGYRWTNVRATPIRDAQGLLRKWAGMNVDIHDHKTAEDALRQSQEQLQALAASLERQVQRRTQELQDSRDFLQSVYDTTLLGLAMLHAERDGASGAIKDFTFRSANQELGRLTGRASLVGRHLAQELPGMVPSGMLALMASAVETGQPQQAELLYPYDGINRWLAVMFVKLDGGVVATILDITERKIAEQQLVRNLHLLEQAETVAQLGSWDYDLATAQFYWSAGMYQLFGLPLGQPVTPLVYLDYVLAEDRPLAEQLVRQITTGVGDLEVTLRLRVHGAIKTVRIKSIVLRNAQGQAVRVLGVDLDISELHRLEADNLRLQLGQQQALFAAVQAAEEAERRRMAESLHNGIGQILYATKLQLDCLPDTPASLPRQQAAHLLGEAIRQTRALSHELTPANLEDFGLAKTLLSMCRTLSGANLHWHCHLDLDEGPALPLPLQLAVYRLAQELAQNVLKHAQATEATLEVDILPAWVVLRVEDNGRGFDPARTSDGLGLRSMRSRAALLGGSVHLTTVLCQGTQCQIRIPLSPLAL